LSKSSLNDSCSYMHCNAHIFCFGKKLRVLIIMESYIWRHWLLHIEQLEQHWGCFALKLNGCSKWITWLYNSYVQSLNLWSNVCMYVILSFMLIVHAFGLKYLMHWKFFVQGFGASTLVLFNNIETWNDFRWWRRWWQWVLCFEHI
jgi:hypothetical protein